MDGIVSMFLQGITPTGSVLELRMRPLSNLSLTSATDPGLKSNIALPSVSCLAIGMTFGNEG